MTAHTQVRATACINEPDNVCNLIDYKTRDSTKSGQLGFNDANSVTRPLAGGRAAAGGAGV